MHHPHDQQQPGTDTAAHDATTVAAEARRPAEVTDPVCGMRLSPAGAATHREVAGVTFHFCSTHCAATFDADPDRYTAGTAGTP
jgi:Cu+-exporting ATPase